MYDLQFVKAGKTMNLQRIFLPGVLLLIPFICGATPQAGHLVMIGGSLNSGNRVIHETMINLAGEDAGIGIVPAAASDWEQSTRTMLGRFESYGVGDRTQVIEVHREDLARAREPEIATQIADKRLLFFTGGQQHRILTAFRPTDVSGELDAYRALWNVLHAGGVIAGSSAGAAMMSDPCIRGGNSTNALSVYLDDGEGRGVRTQQGMGFFPYGIVDQHFMERGRLGRLVVALDRHEIPLGFGIGENRALHADLSTHTLAPIGGHQAVILVDLSEATNNGTSIEGIRVSLLGEGDLIDGRTGTITPSPHRIAVSGGDTVDDHEGISDEPVFTSDEAWESMVVSRALVSLKESDTSFSRITNKDFEVTFLRDGETRVYLAPDEEAESLEEVDCLVVRALVHISRKPVMEDVEEEISGEKTDTP